MDNLEATVAAVRAGATTAMEAAAGTGIAAARQRCCRLACACHQPTRCQRWLVLDAETWQDGLALCRYCAAGH